MLKFEQVGITASAQREAPLRAFDLEIGAGDLHVAVVRRAGAAEALADLALGLRDPGDGRVLWRGRNWRDIPRDEAEAERGRIGRVYERWGWVSNLDVDENLKLSARHHTRRSEADIDRALADWSRRFGLDAPPSSRPAFTDHRALMISQWVRALAGEPIFLLLEHPERNARDDELERLIDALGESRARGAGILWFTNDVRVWQNRALDPVAVLWPERDRAVEIGKEPHDGQTV